MAILRMFLLIVWGILVAVVKLLCLSEKLVLGLFLLVLQLFLVICHEGNSD